MKHQKGQALVAVILIGMVALVAVITSSTQVITEFKKNTSVVNGMTQYQLAYGTLENAFMRLLRDPNYTGETLSFPPSTCTITVTGATTKDVQVKCASTSYVKKFGATVTFSNGIMSVSNILELP